VVKRPAEKNAPRISPARSVGFDILQRVEERDSYASELLHASPSAQLSAADHGLATELVMGVLRWRSTLDAAIARASTLPLNKVDNEVLTALRLGAYQILFLDRIPARAAIHESVELVKRARKRSAAPFVNAILRKLSAIPHIPASKPDSSPSALAQHYAHPEWLVARWLKSFHATTAEQICNYDQQVPHTAVRLRDSSADEGLQEQGIQVVAGEFLPSVRRILAGDITTTAAFRQGQIGIQDEGSQLVALLVGSGRILDCCAAPGGKTAILAARNPRSEVTAIELHPHRARLLRKLVPASNVRVVAADVRQLPLAEAFDSVLVDAPCSGTGTLARNPEIKWRLRAEDLLELQARQREILQAAADRTVSGGRLVYSTCSLEPEENVEVVEHFLSRNKSFQIVDCRRQLEKLRSEGELTCQQFDSLLNGPYLRTIPGVHRCDGFFAAILQRS
jgi:16S rRNA (cytosine967-C5)-methyltransferase